MKDELKLKVCKPAARVGKIFYPKISRGKAECFFIKKANMQKLTKGYLAKRSSFLERKGGPSASADGG